MLEYFNWFLGILCLGSLIYYSFGIYAAIAFFQSPRLLNSYYHPPVTLLKPLCGLETDLYENLASFCQQDYPTYQIIFTVRDYQDPCILLVKQLQRDFPKIDITLVVCDRLIGTNLKISNLANGLSFAKYDLLILSDSDIKVKSDYLQQIVLPFQSENIGVVTCLYRSRTQGWIATFEALGIVTHFHPSVLVARLVEDIHYGFGSTIAIRQSVLQSIGGLAKVANYLADDYQLVHLAYQAGYQVILSPYIVEHYLDTSSLKELIQRQSRWLKCIRTERFCSYLGLIFTYGTVLSFIYFICTQGSVSGEIIVAITLFLRLFLAILVGDYYFQDPVVKKGWWLIPFQDIFRFFLWIYGLLSNTVTWRGQTFQLLKGGQIIPLEKDTLSPLMELES